MNDDSCCGNCRFWDESGTVAASSWEGRCRRYAPRPRYETIAEAVMSDGITKRYALWPPTSADDWCGEWKEKATP